MKTVLLVCFILAGLYVQAQDTATSSGNKKDTFTSVQVEARFPGGPAAWQTFLINHIHPAVAANHKAPPGNYTVTVSFFVDKEGRVTAAQILKDPGYGTAADVLKAFKHMPDWIPALQNGKPVIYRQRQNITYQVTQN